MNVPFRMNASERAAAAGSRTRRSLFFFFVEYPYCPIASSPQDLIPFWPTQVFLARRGAYRAEIIKSTAALLDFVCWGWLPSLQECSAALFSALSLHSRNKGAEATEILTSPKHTYCSSAPHVHHYFTTYTKEGCHDCCSPVFRSIVPPARSRITLLCRGKGTTSLLCRPD